MGGAARWDTPEYQRIDNAEIRGNDLTVLFEDGDRVQLKVDRLLPQGLRAGEWNAMTHNAYEIIVPTSTGQVEIPWTTIRALTDRNYATHTASFAEEQARQVGQQIKELREQRGLSSKEVAERAGISPQSLSRIENGDHDVVYATLQEILATMGATLADLMTSPQKPPRVRVSDRPR